MALSHKGLNETLSAFIRTQPLFFVATAASDGRVNLSPKGMDTLRILSSTRILWLNLSGSGNETAAHIRENPRMTLMFCAFEGRAMILRLYGSAKVIHPYDKEWQNIASHFPKLAGSRQIFDVEIESLQVSCGSGVPVMTVASQRGLTELVPFYDKLGEKGVEDYWARKNALSIDGKDTGISLKSAAANGP